MTASDIIDDLGGTSAVASALGLTPSTVHGWRKANFIPRWWQREVLSLAMDKQKSISATDFPSIEERVSKVKAAA